MERSANLIANEGCIYSGTPMTLGTDGSGFTDPSQLTFDRMYSNKSYFSIGQVIVAASHDVNGPIERKSLFDALKRTDYTLGDYAIQFQQFANTYASKPAPNYQITDLEISINHNLVTRNFNFDLSKGKQLAESRRARNIFKVEKGESRASRDWEKGEYLQWVRNS